MVWDPRSIGPTGAPSRAARSTRCAAGRSRLYTIVLFVLGLARRLFVLPGRFGALALALLAYQTLVAMVFAARPATACRGTS